VTNLLKISIFKILKITYLLFSEKTRKKKIKILRFAVIVTDFFRNRRSRVVGSLSTTLGAANKIRVLTSHCYFNNNVL
jgi:hypothetical protein